MDTATLAPALAALAGGLVGVGGTVTVTVLGHKAARKDRPREQVREAAGELLATCDAIWVADCAVVMAVFSLTNSENRHDEGRRTAVDYYDAQRVAAIREHSDALARARSLIGSLSLIRPELEAPAAVLLKGSAFTTRSRSKPKPSAEDTAAKDAVRAEFVKAARRVIDKP